MNDLCEAYFLSQPSSKQSVTDPTSITNIKGHLWFSLRRKPEENTKMQLHTFSLYNWSHYVKSKLMAWIGKKEFTLITLCTDLFCLLVVDNTSESQSLISLLQELQKGMVLF